MTLTNTAENSRSARMAGMAGTNIITLFQGPDAWMAHFSGPYADFVRRAFGTDILPTAFTIQAAEKDVYAAMVAMNPGFVVILEAQC